VENRQAALASNTNVRYISFPVSTQNRMRETNISQRKPACGVILMRAKPRARAIRHGPAGGYLVSAVTGGDFVGFGGGENG
jgi:hypothetical protein